jgi:hypothetical protein
MCDDKPNCGCNKMIKARNYRSGGAVKSAHKNIPKGALPKGDVDTVYARLQPGEVVIPKKHSKTVAKFLKEKKIKLPGM